MAESRRERRLREALEANAGPSEQAPPPGASPYRTPSAPYQVGPSEASPYAGPAPDALPSKEQGPQAPVFADGAPQAPEPGVSRRILRAAVPPGLGFLLLAWAMTTLVGDVSWGPFGVVPVGLACLSPLTVVPAVPLVLLAIGRRRWAALVPTVAAAALPWFFVLGYVVPANPQTGSTVPLRAMIVTAHDGQADVTDIASAVGSQRIDLLVVTELSAALAHQLALAGLPDGLTPRFVSVPDPGTPAVAGIGVYSRFDVDQTRVRVLTSTQWPAVSMPVTVGRTTITLVAGHVVQPSVGNLDRWRRDLNALGAEEARTTGPVLLLANLNATPWNPQFRRLVAGRFHDAADVLGQGLRPTWPNWSPVPLLPTDHALVAGLGVSDSSALPIDGSDHRALAVGLVVPA